MMRPFKNSLMLLLLIYLNCAAQLAVKDTRSFPSDNLQNLPPELILRIILCNQEASIEAFHKTIKSLNCTSKLFHAIISEHCVTLFTNLCRRHGRAAIFNFFIKKPHINIKKPRTKGYSALWPFSDFLKNKNCKFFQKLPIERLELIELHTCKPTYYINGLSEKLSRLSSYMACNVIGSNNATPANIIEAAANNLYYKKKCKQCNLCNQTINDHALKKIPSLPLKARIALLYHYIKSKNFDQARQIIKENNDLVNCRLGIEQATPLMRAIEYQNIKFINLLLEKGADTTATNICGENIANYLFYSPSFEKKVRDQKIFGTSLPASSNRYLPKNEFCADALEYLINVRYMEINNVCPFQNGTTILHELASSNHPNNLDAARIVLNTANYFINSLDENHTTPLMRAAECGNSTMVDYLLKRKAKTDQTDTKGEDVSYYAARGGTQDIMKHFLPRNINPFKPKQSLLLITAAKAGNKESFSTLLENNAHLINCRAFCPPLTPLIAAIKANKPKMVKYILRNGANPDLPANETEAPILQAQNLGLFNIIQILLELGANSNACDHEGNTSLMRALQKKQNDIAQLLLHSEQLKIDVTNKQGYTALTIAALANLITETKLLLEKGANPHINFPISQSPITRRKITAPFTIALVTNDQWTKSERLTAIQLLQKLGVTFNAQDKNGKTALMHAQEMGWQELASLLTTSQC